MKHFDVAARRRRLVRRHHLATPGPGVEAVAGDLVGLHATDPATVYLSLQQRLDGFSVADLDAALYERRSLARVLCMRRTMFVLPFELAALADASCTKALVAAERRRTVQLLEADGFADAERVVRRACAATLAVLRDAEPMAARELTAIVAEIQQQVVFAAGKHYESRTAITGRILHQLAIEGQVVRTRPLGSWLSSQYRWTTFERWFGEPFAVVPAEKARAGIVRAWLRTYGPGTTTDLAWWSKWTRQQVGAALDEAGAVAVTVEPAPGADPVAAWVLPDDVDDADDADVDADDVGGAVVALLPALDPAIMGWKQRDWIIGGHSGELFDTNGNAGPTILVDGVAAGAWGQLADGRVVTGLVENVTAPTRRRIDAAAESLGEWLRGVRVMPRFPGPLQRRLAAGEL